MIPNHIFRGFDIDFFFMWLLHFKRLRISRSLGFCKLSKKFPTNYHLYKANIAVEYFQFYVVLGICCRTEQQEEPAKTENEESKEQEDTENKENEDEEEGKNEVSL